MLLHFALCAPLKYLEYIIFRVQYFRLQKFCLALFADILILIVLELFAHFRFIFPFLFFSFDTNLLLCGPSNFFGLLHSAKTHRPFSQLPLLPSAHREICDLKRYFSSRESIFTQAIALNAMKHSAKLFSINPGLWDASLNFKISFYHYSLN